RRPHPGRRRGAPAQPVRVHRGARLRLPGRGLGRRRCLGGPAGVARGGRPAMSAPRLAVEVGGMRLKNPLLAASGTFGYGVEYEGLLDLSLLGGLVSKGLYLDARDGCAVPRIVETPSGLLNAIGLQGIGIRAFVKDVLPRLARYDTAVVVNVCGDTVEEYAEVSRIADAPGVAALEVNISCPNVKKGGLAFGGDPRMTH